MFLDSSSNYTKITYNGKPLDIHAQGDMTTELLYNTLSKITDPDGLITHVDPYVLYSKTNLQSINLPNCLEVGSYAFAYCSSLSDVQLPLCSTINAYAFTNCKSLSNIYLPNCVEIASNAFGSCTNLQNISLPNCITIRDSAFLSCSSLQYLNLPNLESAIGTAFWSTGFRTISIPKITSYRTSFFLNCYNLKEFEFPEGTQSIPAMFSTCAKLSKVFIPSTVSYVTSNAFAGASSNFCIVCETNSNISNFASKWFYSGTKQFGVMYDKTLVEYKNTWEPVTVKFDTQGGTCAVSNRDMLFGEQLKTLPMAYKDSYLFLGWTKDLEYPRYVTIDSTVDSLNYILYAHWQPAITVDLDSDGGSLPFKYNVGNISTSKYFTFDGKYWNSGDTNDNDYCLCEVSFTTYKVNTDITFYVISSGEPGYDYGIFSDLNTSLINSNVIDTNNVYKSFLNQASTNEQPLVYNIQNPGTYIVQVKWRKDGSQSHGNDSLKFRVVSEDTTIYSVALNEVYNLPIPTKEGHIFEGWYTEDGIKITEETICTNPERHTLYARYTTAEGN